MVKFEKENRVLIISNKKSFTSITKRALSKLPRAFNYLVLLKLNIFNRDGQNPESEYGVFLSDSEFVFC